MFKSVYHICTLTTILSSFKHKQPNFNVENWIAYPSFHVMLLRFKYIYVLEVCVNLYIYVLNLHPIVWAADCRPLWKKALISYLRLDLGDRSGSIL
jgi:hypothetical protein